VTTPIFALADEYIDAFARLSPMWAGAVGVKGDFGVATDLAPTPKPNAGSLSARRSRS
jgi:hypothetical protein